eukprot:TRINITY_DN17264_c0_g1_i2.p1 TRINITY_DN17264_c0_g1~~TRINITY_DN17264_c0_g1_i2.p1  ORF type:complete len:348 (-),score=64.58 TRINITY_DN17264_c0_g1_i2:56-1099(-)
MAQEPTWTWGFLIVITVLNLTPLTLSLSARWLLLSGRSVSRWLQHAALLRVHNVVLAQIAISYLCSILILVTRNWASSEHCGSSVWWIQRSTSAAAQGFWSCATITCTCLLCATDGVGARGIRKAMLLGALMGSATAGCNLLQSGTLVNASCSFSVHHGMVPRNLSNSLKCAIVFLSSLVMMWCAAKTAASDECRRIPSRLLWMFAVLTLLLGTVSVTVETVDWYGRGNTKGDVLGCSLTWDGLFHCEGMVCVLSIGMWMVAFGLHLVIYLSLRADGIYWNSLGMSVHTDTALLDHYDSNEPVPILSLIHISEPTRLLSISYAVFCLKKKKKNNQTTTQKKQNTIKK